MSFVKVLLGIENARAGAEGALARAEWHPHDSLPSLLGNASGKPGNQDALGAAVTHSPCLLPSPHFPSSLAKSQGRASES